MADQLPNYWDARASIRIDYESLVPGSSESLVEGIWTDILMHIFPFTSDFTLRVQPGLPGSSRRKPDMIVQRVQNGRNVPFLMVENKRVEYENWDSKWDEAVAQLIDYLSTVSQQEHIDTLYGAAAVGRHVRFYTFKRVGSELRDFAGTHGDHFHVRHDRTLVQDFLLRIRHAVAGF
ncbi:MAG: hypothetical protein M1817_006866 [Caeruleum heppii]|nr:MAG: hypothetical protein M1817_006866 [Caeruleum heppii]